MTAPNIFEKIGLNESPDFSMEEITKNLFDNEFLSDMQFKFEANVIHAHTWELKKRSIVFQKQFQKSVADLVIPVTDIPYQVFYEFIRFLYTDECEINEYNRIDLLNLARKYKIIRLETKLINGISDCLDAFEFCVLQKYDLLYNLMREWIEKDLHSVENSFKLQTLHPDVMEEILKLDYLQNFEELKIFQLLMTWINYTSDQQNIPLTERRARFDKYIRLIRFPAMTIEEFTDCVNKSIDLFSKQDIIAIFRQISLGTRCTDQMWNPKPRLTNMDPHRVIGISNHWETKLTVLNNVILRGVRFAFCNFRSNFQVLINGKDVKSNATQSLTFTFDKSLCNDSEIVVNLGDTIELKPNYEYTVEVNAENGLKVPLLRDDRRPKIQDVELNLAQPQEVRKLKESSNLLEIIYKVREPARQSKIP